MPPLHLHQSSAILVRLFLLPIGGSGDRDWTQWACLRRRRWIRCGGRIEGQEEVGMVGWGGLAGDDKAGWSELDLVPGRHASAPHFSSTSLLPDARGKNFRSPARRKQNAHQLLFDIMVVAQKPAKRISGIAKALAIAEDLGFPAPPCFIVFCIHVHGQLLLPSL